MGDAPVKLTIEAGPPGGRPLIDLTRLVLAEDLANAYDDYRRIRELEHMRAEGIELVGGEGALDAPVMIIGEAPGEEENEQGRPFVGPAGRLLRKHMHRIGLSPAECFITNVVKYRPLDIGGRNRKPLHFEIELSRACLDAEIDIVKPDLIVVAGGTALSVFHPQYRISKIQGTPIMTPSGLMMPIYHPSAALRTRAVMDEFIDSFDLLGTIVNG
jgi:uracil-DNA glycosylase